MYRRRAGWLVVAIVATARSASAQSDDELTPEELAEIEAAVGADTATPAKPPPATSMNPDIAFVLDVAAAYSSDQATELQRELELEMSVGKSVDPYFRFDGAIAFSEEGAEVEEAYATTLALPANLQMRFGQFLTRFGRLNSMHAHRWDFVDRPFVPGAMFGEEGNRGIGAEASYLTPLPWFVELVGSLTDGGEESPLDYQGTISLKQFFELTHDLSLLSGLSFATGPNGSDDDNRTDLYGADLYLKYRPITFASDTVVALQAEWFYRRTEIPGDVVLDHGGYAHLFWRFARRWGAGARYEYGDETGDRHRVAAALTFWPTEFSRLRAQGSVDLPEGSDDPIVAAFLAMEFSVGAHGAHAF